MGEWTQIFIYYMDLIVICKKKTIFFHSYIKCLVPGCAKFLQPTVKLQLWSGSADQ